MIKQLRQAESTKLHAEAGYLGQDLLEGKTAKFDHAENVTTGICAGLGLS